MTDSEKTPQPKAVDVDWRRTQAGFAQFVDVVTPWLLELGGWIFGGLIAFDLVMLGVVLTIGPVDIAIKISTAAFALSLPLNVTGFVLLRLVADMSKIRLQETASQAFQDAGFQVEDVPDPKTAERQIGSVALAYTYSLMALTILLTLTGLTTALWHGDWWIGAGFLAAVLISQIVLVAAVSNLDAGRQRWTSPSANAEAKKPS